MVKPEEPPTRWELSSFPIGQRAFVSPASLCQQNTARQNVIVESGVVIPSPAWRVKGE